MKTRPDSETNHGRTLAQSHDSFTSVEDDRAGKYRLKWHLYLVYKLPMVGKHEPKRIINRTSPALFSPTVG